MQAHAQAQNDETCIICGQTGTSGIHICHQLICDSCQRKMIETDVTDRKYKHYVKKLSKLRLNTAEKARQNEIR
ncbi:sigma-G inhibitor, Gin [Sporolactobacillus sp. THM7-7]|nr:sigma-G inhibitor, Gin [Sporolactobacillus sp. THM7-7]